jgi:hypothetical protein
MTELGAAGPFCKTKREGQWEAARKIFARGIAFGNMQERHFRHSMTSWSGRHLSAASWTSNSVQISIFVLS